MKSTIILIGVIMFGSLKAHAQNLIFKNQTTTTDVNNIAADIYNEIPPKGDRRLITTYTFNRAFSNDFAKIISVENATNGAIKYASLSIDKSKSTFDFAPVIFKIGKYENGKPLRAYGNVHVKGQIGSDGTATIFNSKGFNKSFTVGTTFNFPWGRNTNFYKMSSPGKEEDEFDELQKNLIISIKNDYTSKIKAAETNGRDKVNNVDILTDVKALEKAIRKDFSDAEEKLGNKKWTIKTRNWATAGINLGGQTQSVFSTKSQKTLDTFSFTPDFELSYNYFVEWLKGTRKELYLTVTASYAYKNSFADMKAQTWNHISKISDTTYLGVDQKSVYILDSTYRQGLAPAINFEGIYIIELKKIPVGVDAAFKTDFPFTKGAPTKYTQTYGVVFPFKNKDGNRSINIEIFYSHQTFEYKNLAGVETWGLKFALPIFSSDK